MLRLGSKFLTPFFKGFFLWSLGCDFGTDHLGECGFSFPGRWITDHCELSEALTYLSPKIKEPRE